MLLPGPVSQFIAFNLKVHDIHFQTIFKLFSFWCSFRQFLTYFHPFSWSHPFSCIPKNNISTDIICHRCFVFWTMCVIINVF